MIWEIGEHAAFILKPAAWLLSPFWKCRCKARRTALNARGEKWYRYWFPGWHIQMLGSWCVQARDKLEAGICPLSELSDTVSQNTAERWLSRLVQEGRVAVIVMNGQKLYGLPGNGSAEALVQ